MPDTKTVIGSHGNFLAYSHVAHDCIVGDHVIFSNNGTLAGHVIVEDHAVIGGLSGGASVLPNWTARNPWRLHEDRSRRSALHDRRRQSGGDSRCQSGGS